MMPTHTKTDATAMPLVAFVFEDNLFWFDYTRQSYGSRILIISHISIAFIFIRSNTHLSQLTKMGKRGRERVSYRHSEKENRTKEEWKTKWVNESEQTTEGDWDRYTVKRSQRGQNCWKVKVNIGREMDNKLDKGSEGGKNGRALKLMEYNFICWFDLFAEVIWI